MYEAWIAKPGNRERKLANKRAWIVRNPERHKATGKAWFAKNQERRFEYQLREKYNLSVAGYNAILAKQGGVCAICHQPPPVLRKERTIRRLWVDHCHETGTVRGLLCNKCNSVIGLALDDPSILQSAIDYLRSAHGR